MRQHCKVTSHIVIYHLRTYYSSNQVTNSLAIHVAGHGISSQSKHVQGGWFTLLDPWNARKEVERKHRSVGTNFDYIERSGAAQRLTPEVCAVTITYPALAGRAGHLTTYWSGINM